MSNMLKGHIVCFVAAMALVVSSVSAQKIRKATVLADDGKAFMSVVVSTNATDKVHKTAEDLVS